ncbi:MAG: DUF917 family protein [Armatimonadota bacterium]|nr:DUF917 family protein [Armatimonadota bacterium]MDR7520245.1 DUF917 family protein [Armatimonadota bacterium]MDR7549419.1 DUF917 family protein [Armatimonadota bacterium]
MNGLRLTAQHVEAAVLGGAVLGGGGGGWIPDGLERGRLAVQLGTPELAAVDDLPPDAMIVTAAAVGAPSPKERFVRPVDYIRAVQVLVERTGIRLGGIIANENGASATVNGWLQAAALGVPVVDAPCNGRAHPTGLMGAMGLHRQPGYTSHQVAVGGNPATGRYLEVHAAGALARTAALIREASVEAGGIVAVARDPVPQSYVREHGAPGAVRQAIAVGEALIGARGRGGSAVLQSVAAAVGGQIVDVGTVEGTRLEVSGGFDVGRVEVAGRRGRHELAFWNEYMTLDSDGQRAATFPDLITTLNSEDGVPVAAAEIEPGMRVAILVAPKARLILGAGMRDPQLFRDVERAIGKEVVRYAF